MKNKVEDSYLYFDLTTQERDSAIRYLLGAIIKCREEAGLPSNSQVFDEDVNVYLAHLLFAFSLPEYHEMAAPYLTSENSDLLRWINATEDKALRYFIFKVNADNLLVHSSIFDDLGRKSRRQIFKHPQGHYHELAKMYYGEAATYHNRIYRKKTGVGDVLHKISEHYDMYHRLLKDVRREYFGFMNNFRDQAFHYFMKNIKDFENEIKKKEKLDEFLDLYSRWRQSKEKMLELQVRQVIKELQRLDPNFKFDFDQHLRRQDDQDQRDAA